jgi:hypothetical protein
MHRIKLRGRDLATSGGEHDYELQPDDMMQDE